MKTLEIEAVQPAAAAIAHGIRNPLASIRAQLEILRDQVDLLDDRRQGIDRALEEIDRIAGTVDAILDHGSTPNPEWKTCDLASVLAEASQPLLPKAERRGLRVRREGLDRQILALTDPRLFGRSVGRILENAIDASEDGGDVELYCDRSPGFAQVTIVDHGQGMSADEIGRLGEAFYTRKAQGLGLGLHLALRDLRHLGAKVEIRSERGRGTTVSIQLPQMEDSP